MGQFNQGNLFSFLAMTISEWAEVSRISTGMVDSGLSSKALIPGRSA